MKNAHLMQMQFKSFRPAYVNSAVDGIYLKERVGKQWEKESKMLER